MAGNMTGRGGLNPSGIFDIRRLMPQNPYGNLNPQAAAMPMGSSPPMAGSTLNIRAPQMAPAFADGGMVPSAPPQAEMAPPAPPQAGMTPQAGMSPPTAPGQRMSLQQLQQEAQKFAQANPQAIQMIREALMEGIQDGDVTPQQVTMLVQMAVAVAQNPELYPRLRQMAIQQGLADEDDLPMQYDQGIVFSLIVAGAAMQQEGGQPMAGPVATPAPQGPTPTFREGGHIPMTRSPTGDNTGRADDIPIRVSGGEYVIPKNVVERKGTEFFDKLIGKDKGVA
jgi:hypothetical protein